MNDDIVNAIASQMSIPKSILDDIELEPYTQQYRVSYDKSDNPFGSFSTLKTFRIKSPSLWSVYNGTAGDPKKVSGFHIAFARACRNGLVDMVKIIRKLSDAKFDYTRALIQSYEMCHYELFCYLLTEGDDIDSIKLEKLYRASCRVMLEDRTRYRTAIEQYCPALKLLGEPGSWTKEKLPQPYTVKPL